MANTLTMGEKPMDFFVMITNDFVRDPTITPRAARLYIYLASHSDTWKLYVKAIQNATGMGRGTIYKALDDLRTAGYVQRTRLFDEAGKFNGYDYRVLSYPLPEEERDKDISSTKGHVPESGKRDDQAKQEESAGQDHLPESGRPQTVKPVSDTHKKINLQEDQHQEDQQEDMSNPGGFNEPKKQARHKYPPEFDAWWFTFPKRTGSKRNAYTQFKAALKRTDLDTLMDGARRIAAFVEAGHREVQYVKDAERWLKGDMWEEELMAPPTVSPQSGLAAWGAPSTQQQQPSGHNPFRSIYDEMRAING